MKLLFGNYDVSIDEKNRMLVPSEIRRALDLAPEGEGIFAVPGVNKKLWIYPEKFYEEMARQARSQIAPPLQRLEFDQLNFALAARLEWDKQGRILLPEKLIRKTSLDRDVTVVGMRDHAEIWNRAEWARQEDILEQRRSEITEPGRPSSSESPVGEGLKG